MDDFFKKARVSFHYDKEVEPNEVLVDKLAKRREKEVGAPEGKIEIPLLKKIVKRFFLFSFFIILVLFSRTLQLQIFKKEELLAQAEQNRYIFNKLKANRGVVYDQNMEQLVFNVPSFDLVCQKADLPSSPEEREKVISEVEKIIEWEPSSLEKKIEAEEESFLVVENIPHPQLIILETKVDDLPGFTIRDRLIREYKEGELFSHLLGYTGRITKSEIEDAPHFYSVFDFVGRSGIEQSYEEVLRKDPGEVRIERDALGNVISKEVISLPESGKSLILWLDAGLQRKIQEELQSALQKVGSRQAVGVALDPKTGGVLSLVSIPSFDNNIFSRAEKESLQSLFSDPETPLFNRAVSGIGYPTGSTIKPLIAAAALEEGVVDPQRKIHCEGLIEVPHQYDPETVYKYHDWNVHGWTDMRKAIAESCNVYFYSLGGGYEEFGIQGLGSKKIKEYLNLFGWGERTGIDLPNEGKGSLPDTEKNWWKGNTYHLSIGQGPFSITPLQVANAFVSIANGGKLLEPHVVKEVVAHSENSVSTVKEIETKAIRQGFVDPQHVKVVKEGMRQAVTGTDSPLASATLLNSLPVSAGAKTGTAETPKEGLYHNWITVFAPYDDPEIVLTLIIENVEGVRAAVLPPAKAILEWYFSS